MWILVEADSQRIARCLYDQLAITTRTWKTLFCSNKLTFKNDPQIVVLQKL